MSKAIRVPKQAINGRFIRDSSQRSFGMTFRGHVIPNDFNEIRLPALDEL